MLPEISLNETREWRNSPNLNILNRPYTMALYTLQDSLKAILHTPNTHNLGHIENPKMTIKDDGTLELSLSVPMYIRNSEMELVENPIWYTVKDGNLIAGMEKIKVIFGNNVEYIPPQKTSILNAISASAQGQESLLLENVSISFVNELISSGEENSTLNVGYLSLNKNNKSVENEVFEFLITKVNEQHSSGILTCEITAQGLAFNELGKNGRLLTFNSDLYELEYEATYDGFINEVNPYGQLENCSLDETDINGYSIKLDFYSKVYDVTNTTIGQKEEDVINIRLNINTAIPLEENKNYTLSFTSNLTEEDGNIRWKIFDREYQNLSDNNILNIKLNSYEVNNYISYIPLQIINLGSSNKPTIKNFKFVLDEEVKANLNFWMDKVVENTDWTYSVQMDWSSYDGVALEKPYEQMTSVEKGRLNKERAQDDLRRLDTIYEDEYVTSWETNTDGTVIPTAVQKFKEKERIIEKNESNRYNLTQEIAEKFEVNCKYKYYYDEHFRIIGKEIIFFNNFIKDMDIIDITYPYDTSEVSREMDSTDIVTKMYVENIDDDTNLTTGLISITDTLANKSKENYILNFDYLYNIGTISKDQYDEVAIYEAKMREFNEEIMKVTDEMAVKEIERNEQKANVTYYTRALAEDSDRIQEADKMLKAITRNGDSYIVQINGSNYDSKTVLVDSVTKQKCIKIYKTGILPETLKIFKDSKFTKPVNFNPDIKVENASTTKVFILDTLDPTENIVYTQYDYQPSLYYTNLKSDYKQLYELDFAKKEKAEEEYKNLNEDCETLNNKLNILRRDKAKEIGKFDKFMGPAIREGSWKDEDYTDYGNKKYANITYVDGSYNSTLDEVSFKFDEEPLDGEQLNYYESGILAEKIYYPYIIMNDNILGYLNEYKEDLCVAYGKCWTNLDDIEVDFGASGNAHYIRRDTNGNTENLNGANEIIGVIVDGVSYDIWDINKTYDIGDVVFYNNKLYQSIISDNKNRAPEFYCDPAVYRINSQLVPAFYKINDVVTPVLMLVDAAYDKAGIEINPEIATQTITIVDGKIVVETSYLDDAVFKYDEQTMVYPRIVINDLEIKTSDSIIIHCKNSDTAGEYVNDDILNQFIDYTTYVQYKGINNNGKEIDDAYLFNIKPYAILARGNTYCNYDISYFVSNASTSMYLDALKVSKENAFPKVSYNVKINAVNKQLIEKLYLRLNQICHINDTDLKFKNVRGYISEMVLNLDEPWNDEITIQNYKTKFEDLFSSIVASTEQMKSNGTAYNIAANAFMSNGALSQDSLQQTITNGDIVYDFDRGNLIIDQEKGIWANSYDEAGNIDGVVAIRGGGISIANETDENGQWKWHTGITPEGINASLLKAGQLDTSLIKIFAGDQVAFQMNAQGLFAYRNIDNNLFTEKEFVVHNGEGLFLVNTEGYSYNDEFGNRKTLSEDINRVEISWDGLILRNLNNEKVFYADTEGNLTLMGAINAEAGNIGQWIITDNGLVSEDGNFGVTPNSVTGDVIWVKGKNGDSFSVDKNGVVNATSAVFEQSILAKEVTVNGVPLSAVIEQVGVEEGVFYTSILGEVMKIEDGVGYPNKLIYSISSYAVEINDDEDGNGNISIEYNLSEDNSEDVWIDINSEINSEYWTLYNDADLSIETLEEWTDIDTYNIGDKIVYDNKIFMYINDEPSSNQIPLKTNSNIYYEVKGHNVEISQYVFDISPNLTIRFKVLADNDTYYYTKEAALIMLKDGTDGVSYNVVIEAQGGIVFKNGEGSKTLIARVFRNGIELNEDNFDKVINYKWTWKQIINDGITETVDNVLEGPDKKSITINITDISEAIQTIECAVSVE